MEKLEVLWLNKLLKEVFRKNSKYFFFIHFNKRSELATMRREKSLNKKLGRNLEIKVKKITKILTIVDR